jgi:hypothetical protein
MDEMQVVVESVIKEPFWAGAIARFAITEEDARRLIPVVLVTPQGEETPAYLASLIEPMQRLLDYEAQNPMERENV